MFKEELKATGSLKIYLFDGDFDGDFSRAISITDVKNLIVATGKSYIAARLGSSPPAVMTHMAIGGSAAPPAPIDTDTALVSEIARVAVSPAGGTSTNNTVLFTATFPAGTGTSSSISEAGIFSASSAGTMLARTTFSPLNKTAGNAMVIVWTVQIS